MSIENSIKILQENVSYLVKLVETMIEEKKGCKEKKNVDLMKIIDGLPFSDHPAFKKIIEEIRGRDEHKLP